MGENSNSRTTIKRSTSVDTSVDVSSLRRAYSHLFKLPLKIFEGKKIMWKLNLINNIFLNG